MKENFTMKTLQDRINAFTTKDNRIIQEESIEPETELPLEGQLALLRKEVEYLKRLAPVLDFAPMGSIGSSEHGRR